jgi:nitrogen-specific signal transduction histidine kinase/CheY-like chemotaxis protein
VIDVQIDSHQVEFDGRPVRVVLARDVTEQRRLEQQFRQAQKMDAIGNLAGGVAHDFNNILLVIRGLSSILLERLEGEERERVGEIDLAARRAAELTQQLLAFSRRQVLRPEAIDLNVVVRETLALFGRLIGEDVVIIDQLSPEPQTILVDRSQLQQVILNLLVNARDAISDGGTVTVRTSSAELDELYVAERLEVEPGSYATLEVTDTGTGMDEETRSRVFDPFFTTKETGTGLGLATVYGILKQSGGHIGVYSEPGIGSTFRVYVPLTDRGAEVKPATAAAPSNLAGDETLLVVEDDDGVRQLVIELLQGRGYDVLAARGGHEALELARAHAGSIALLITDVVMPGMNGRELSEQLIAESPGVKALFTSGYPADTVIRHGITEARFAFIQKPYSAEELLRAVRVALDA